MTSFPCPHCAKDINVSGSDKPFTESKASDSLRETKPSVQEQSNFKGTLVNAGKAKNMKSKINIEGTLERKGAKRTINLKTGSQLDTCDAFIKDDSGDIKVTFWGDDVNKIIDGTRIRIENGYTNTYKGEISLTKGKYGNLIIL